MNTIRSCMKESVLIPVMSLFFKAFYVLVNGLMEFLWQQNILVVLGEHQQHNIAAMALWLLIPWLPNTRKNNYDRLNGRINIDQGIN